MKLKTIVGKYSDLMSEIQAVEKKNGLEAKRKELDNLAKQIKDVARSVEDSEVEKSSTDLVLVRVDRKYRRFYDLEAIKKFASKEEYKLIQENALKIEVDRAKFGELVESELVSRETNRKCLREEEMTPAVVIKIKNEK